VKTVIRKATIADANEIYGFICELEETNFSYPVFEHLYQTNILNPDFIYLVSILDESEIAGYISCHGQVLLHHCEKVFEIQEFFVRERYRGRGIGKQLLGSLEQVLKNTGSKFLEVTSHIKRGKTHKFYSKAGFLNTHLKFTKIM